MVRDGDFKLIWGTAKLLEKHHDSEVKSRRKKLKYNKSVENRIQLFNIKDDPHEKHPLDTEEYRVVVDHLKTILMKEYPKTTFPKYYLNTDQGLPGNNDGFLVTGWC